MRVFFQWWSYLLILLFCSCSKPGQPLPAPAIDEKGSEYFDNEKDLVNWYNNNGQLIKKRQLGGFEFTLKRLSPDILALQELKGKAPGKSEFEEARSHYSDMVYFKLNIQNNDVHQELLKYNLKDAGEYSERIQYCSFQINQDLLLQNERDSVPCALHEFERTFNIESGLNFLLAFPKIDENRGFTVVYQDRLFQQGIIKFYFDGKNDLPYLKTK